MRFRLPMMMVPVVLAACTENELCADFGPNTTLTDVGYDEGGNRLSVSFHHSLSYCSGGDAPRYMVRRLTVDLSAMTPTLEEKKTVKLKMYPLPEAYRRLFERSNFRSNTCAGCELRLQNSDGRYVFVFTALKDPYTAYSDMLMNIFEEGEMKFQLGLGQHLDLNNTSPMEDGGVPDLSL